MAEQSRAKGRRSLASLNVRVERVTPRQKGRRSLASLNVRVERVTPPSVEPLWLSKPGAVSVRERSGDI